MAAKWVRGVQQCDFALWQVQSKYPRIQSYLPHLMFPAIELVPKLNEGIQNELGVGNFLQNVVLVPKAVDRCPE